jgi:hypothetical protein
MGEHAHCPSGLPLPSVVLPCNDPPNDVVFAECMSVSDEAEILSDVFHDALSDSFDVDVEYDVAP